MMRRTLLIVLAVALCSSTEAVGQGKKKIWERLSFRESFSDVLGRSRPASFSVLLPGDTTPSYSIRTAMRVDLGFGSVGRKVDIGPYVEYRRHTNIRLPQNVFMVGLSMDWQTRDAEAEQQPWSAVLVVRVNYKNDFVRATKSVQTNVLFTPVAQGGGGGRGILQNLFLPNVPTHFGTALQFTYSPYIGFEHERVLSAAVDSLEGSVVRTVARVRAEMLPLPSQLSQRLELNFEYSYVYDLMNRADPNRLTPGHRLVKANANVWFVRTDAGRLAGVSLQYTNGESPSVGFRRQRLAQLTFAAKF